MHTLLDHNGDDMPMPVSEALEKIKAWGCYGFTDQEECVFIWVDRAVTDMNTLIALLSHERGHFIRPFKRNDNEDEYKAEIYSLVVTWAYQAANTILNTDCVDKLEEEYEEELKAGSVVQ